MDKDWYLYWEGCPRPPDYPFLIYFGCTDCTNILVGCLSIFPLRTQTSFNYFHGSLGHMPHLGAHHDNYTFLAPHAKCYFLASITLIATRKPSSVSGSPLATLTFRGELPLSFLMPSHQRILLLWQMQCYSRPSWNMPAGGFSGFTKCIHCSLPTVPSLWIPSSTI